MQIERLDLRDRDTAEELWSLQHAAYRIEASLIGVADLPPLRETIGDLQACGETFWGLRTPEGQLAGALATEREGEKTIICRMMVHPAFFRQGIGHRLLSRVMAEHSPNGLWEVTAEIRNRPAIALYEKNGFRPVETFSPVPGITMVRMRSQAEASSPARD